MAAWRTTKRPPAEETITTALAALQEKLPLFNEEVETLALFIPEVRVARQLGRVREQDFEAVTTTYLVLAVGDYLTRAWQSCLRMPEVVGRDCEIRVQAQNVQFVVGAASTPTAEDDTGEADQAPKPLLSVRAWSDLALGLDEHRAVWAVTSPPDLGAHFPKQQAVQLSLKGRRWKALLQVAAEAADGRTLRTADLLQQLGYVSGRPTVDEDPRARPGEVSGAQVHDHGLTVKAGNLGRRLSSTLADFRRESRPGGSG
jgi:hypothetical protein